jgi:anti-sigma factor RsiW
VANDHEFNPELLAAYVDGELAPPERQAVESWLTDHPEARAEVEAQCRIGRAWQSTRPHEPDAGTWAAALENIRARLEVTPLSSRRRLPLRWLVGLAAGILAVISVFLALRPSPPGSLVALGEVDRNEPFQAASADDVEITSLADADSDHVLLVGFAPVRGPMLLASEGEILLDDITPDPGMNPRWDPGAPPMITPAADEKLP